MRCEGRRAPGNDLEVGARCAADERRRLGGRSSESSESSHCSWPPEKGPKKRLSPTEMLPERRRPETTRPSISASLV